MHVRKHQIIVMHDNFFWQRKLRHHCFWFRLLSWSSGPVYGFKKKMMSWTLTKCLLR